MKCDIQTHGMTVMQGLPHDTACNRGAMLVPGVRTGATEAMHWPSLQSLELLTEYTTFLKDQPWAACVLSSDHYIILRKCCIPIPRRLTLRVQCSALHASGP